MITFAAGTVVIVFALFHYSAALAAADFIAPKHKPMIPLLAGIFNSLQITLMNFLYTKVAVKLNDYENYKT